MRALLLFVLALLWAAPLSAQTAVERRDREIRGFEEADRAAPPPAGEIVFVGSSTIVNWEVTKAFPDLRITNRGMWGSSLSDALGYVDRFVIPYQPRMVVLYAGENDVNGGRAPEDVAADFERLVAAVHAKLPLTRIVFIGIKPGPLRWGQVEAMRAANALVRAICARDDRLAFLDIDGVMLGWDEKPRPELFVEDGLHLSAGGYELWTVLLRPLLIAPPPAVPVPPVPVPAPVPLPLPVDSQTETRAIVPLP